MVQLHSGALLFDCMSSKKTSTTFSDVDALAFKSIHNRLYDSKRDCGHPCNYILLDCMWSLFQQSQDLQYVLHRLGVQLDVDEISRFVGLALSGRVSFQ